MLRLARHSRTSRRFVLLLAGLFAVACDDGEVTGPSYDDLAAPALAGAHAPSGKTVEYADVMNQGGLGVYSADGARLVRQPQGLAASVRMPTPTPGGYTLPAGYTPGHPEVFTLWAFVFNYPELCSGPCNGDDLGLDKPARGGAYNLGGHAKGGGGMLNIGGRISTGEAPFRWAPLEAPATAEVHLAVAPHGALDPATLPNEFRIPTGNSACGCWWVSIFLPPAP